MSSHRPRFNHLLTTLTVLSLLHSSVLSISRKSLDYGGVPSDVKYIRCEICSQIAKSATNAINSLESKGLDQLVVLDKVENICDPSTKQGRWMRTIDLVERVGKLRLIQQEATQKCLRECFTMSLACRDVLEDLETELAEKLYALRKKGNEILESDIEKWLCAKKSGITNACRKSPPLLPKDREAGPPFVPKSKKEADKDELMEKLKESGIDKNLDFSMMDGAGAANKFGGAGSDDDDYDDDFDDDDDFEDFEDEDEDDDDDDDEQVSAEQDKDDGLKDTTLGEPSTISFEKTDSMSLGGTAEKAAGVGIGSDEL